MIVTVPTLFRLVSLSIQGCLEEIALSVKILILYVIIIKV